MEKALRYELENRIPELENNIYPTNAPETSTKPYLVYARISTDPTKTLQGYTNDNTITFMFSCMATKYADMKALANKIEAFLKTLPGTTIGTEHILIEDIKINNISEQFENELKVNRGIIDFTIYY